MRSLLAISLVLVCFMDQSDGTFADFMNNLPTEIAKAFSTAWGSMQDAIKKPVKIKRLANGARYRPTTTVRSIETEAPLEVPKRRYDTINNDFPHPVPEPTTPSGRKLMIPHLQASPKLITIGNRIYVWHDYNPRMNKCC